MFSFFFFTAPLNRITVNVSCKVGCCVSIYLWQDAAPCRLSLGIWRKYLLPISLKQKPKLYWSIIMKCANTDIIMNMIVKNRRLYTLRHSLAWRGRRLLLTQGALGGPQVAVATGCGFGGRLGASLWVLAVFYVPHSFHIAPTAHPSTGDLSPFGSPATQGCPVPHWDLDYKIDMRL